jgi:diadenosine tetraphosphate (Ap4A) HIT family hydrolase
MNNCPFCPPYGFRAIQESESSLALYDSYPVSPGHALIVPRRHVPSWFDLLEPEQIDLLKLANLVKGHLDLERHPIAYNLGINDGPQAGQSIPHVHLHLIPRYAGDQVDPRGGIRLIFPEKARYWEDGK